MRSALSGVGGKRGRGFREACSGGETPTGKRSLLDTAHDTPLEVASGECYVVWC